MNLCECGNHCFGKIRRRKSARGTRSIMLLDSVYAQKSFLWNRSVIGSFSGRPYALMPHLGCQKHVHRVVIDAPRWVVVDQIKRKSCVDHINGDSLDNRSCNLKVVTYSDNKKNTAVKRRRERAEMYDDGDIDLGAMYVSM